MTTGRINQVANQRIRRKMLLLQQIACDRTRPSPSWFFYNFTCKTNSTAILARRRIGQQQPVHQANTRFTHRAPKRWTDKRTRVRTTFAVRVPIAGPNFTDCQSSYMLYACSTLSRPHRSHSSTAGRKPRGRSLDSQHSRPGYPTFANRHSFCSERLLSLHELNVEKYIRHTFTQLTNWPSSTCVHCRYPALFSHPFPDDVRATVNFA
jgi:hypothetical protein